MDALLLKVWQPFQKADVPWAHLVWKCTNYCQPWTREVHWSPYIKGLHRVLFSFGTSFSRSCNLSLATSLDTSVASFMHCCNIVIKNQSLRGYTECCSSIIIFTAFKSSSFLAPIINALSVWMAIKAGGNQANDCNGPDPNDPPWQRDGVRALLYCCQANWGGTVITHFSRGFLLH